MEHDFTHYYYYYYYYLYYYLRGFSCLDSSFFMPKIPSSYPLTSLNSYILRLTNSRILCEFLSPLLSLILLQIKNIYGLFGLRGREREQSRYFPPPSKRALSLTLHPSFFFFKLNTFTVRRSITTFQVLSFASSSLFSFLFFYLSSWAALAIAQGVQMNPLTWPKNI